MTTIVSRRHIVKFYLTLLITVLFFLGLGFAMVSIFLKSISQDTIKSKYYFMPVMGAVAVLMALYTVFRYYKNSPKIVIQEDLISFNAEIFSLGDVEKLVLTGKQNFPYVVSFPMEGAVIFFGNGSRKIIFDDMYENSWELKSYLKQVILEKKDFMIPQPIEADRSDLEGECFDTFKGRQLTSLRGISLWGLLGLALYAMLLSNKALTASTIVFFTIFSIYWFILHAWLMHYFQVSDKYVLVRNHLFTWKRKAFRLVDVHEVVFETRNKMPICLRLITKDFRTKLYPAGTLRDKTWLELKRRREKNEVKVRNESV